MRRREFIAVMGAMVALPRMVRAQHAKRIGVLVPYAETDAATQIHLKQFRDELAQHGWREDGNVRIDTRWAGGSSEGLTSAAKELVSLQPDVLFVRSTQATTALLKESRSIPIVFVLVSDPVGDGLVTSLARPGGNVTGFTNVEASLGSKWLQLLKEVTPDLRLVAVVYAPRAAPGGGAYYMRMVENAAVSTGIKTVATPVEDAASIATAIDAFGREGKGGMLVLPDAITTGHRTEIIAAAAKYRLPAIFAFRYFVDEGGLLSYGVEAGDVYRRATSYVDRILRGERPSELPVQAPTKFELVINLKTARSLGIDIAPTLLTRADEVIE